jgi:bacillithiol biosynthesis deacetylase BshB1
MTVDVLAFGAHPDDVELGCGGTLAKLVREGKRVAIVHLTAGEAGTRGTAAERKAEAAAAGAVLGATEVVVLDCGDGDLRTGTAEVDAVVAVLRRLRPHVVLAPPPSDRHPDHGRAHRLVVDASFYAGLARRGSGTPHRPAALFWYMQHDDFRPDFVVDVSADWETKERALSAYPSQLHVPGGSTVSGGEANPATKVATPAFRQAIEGRARHFGQIVGVERAEAFASRQPLLVGSPLDLAHQGVL